MENKNNKTKFKSEAESKIKSEKKTNTGGKIDTRHSKITNITNERCKDVLILQVIWTFFNRSRSNSKYFLFNIQCCGKTSLRKEKKQVRENLFH